MPVGTEARKKKAPAPLRKPATLDHLRKARSVSKVASFCTEDIPEPEAPKHSASEADKKAYEAAYREWQDAVEEATVEMVIASMGRKPYRELLDAHQPTDEAIEKAKKRGEGRPYNNLETFGPALIEQSIAEPEGVGAEEAQNIWDNWPPGDAMALFQACMLLNEQSRLEFHQGKSGGTKG